MSSFVIDAAASNLGLDLAMGGLRCQKERTETVRGPESIQGK
jgi:hypothetical protein